MKKIISSIFVIALAAIIVFSFTDDAFLSSGSNSDDSNSLSVNNSTKKESNRTADIINTKKLTSKFKKVDLFTFNKYPKDRKSLNEFVRTASALKLSKEKIRQLNRSAQENIEFVIPVSETEKMVLELTQHTILSPDFILTSKNLSGDKPEQYTPGIYYKGIIKGDNKSVAAISIFEDKVMGVISNDAGNYNLGEIKNVSSSFNEDYIFYNDADLLVTNNFQCDVDDYDSKFVRDIKEASQNVNHDNGVNSDVATLPVKMYFEADYQMYQDNNSSISNVGDYITSVFNVVTTLYSNELIPIQIKKIAVWTATDPYAYLNDSYSILLEFGGRTQDEFEGNLAHLLSTRPDGFGGIAWIRVLCAEFSPQDSAGRFAFSNIEMTYNVYPTYSWTVMVITHETGHNLGSMHTHACVWPTGGFYLGAIDSCYTAEGNCFSFTQPNNNGTIMSYCHLNGAISLTKGFGPLPGDTVRLRYNQAPCLQQTLNSSENPLTFDLMQNYPNPFNPGTNLKFAVPHDANITLRVFDINGREVAVLLSGRFYSKGTFSYYFDSQKYSLSSGIYFYQLIATDPSKVGQVVHSEVKKMLLVK